MQGKQNIPGTSNCDSKKQPLVDKSIKGFTINEEEGLTENNPHRQNDRHYSTELEEILGTIDRREHSKSSDLTTDDEYKLLASPKRPSHKDLISKNSIYLSEDDTSSEELNTHQYHQYHNYHQQHDNHNKSNKKIQKSISDYVLDYEDSDSSDYGDNDEEGDQDHARFINLPKIEYNHMSINELNTSREIKRIDRNIEENLNLKKENEERAGDFKAPSSESLVYITDPDS